MRELTVDQFTKEDLYHLGLSEKELFIYTQVHYTFPCWTVRHGQEVIFCGGVQRILPQVGEAWLIFAEKGREYVAAFRTARELVQSSRKYFLRIQSTADPAVKENVRFLEHLGFEYEGTRR